MQAGLPVSLVVDLLREESATTFGAAMFPEQAADWQAFPVEVALQSPDIDFDANGLATLTVRRNAASIAATVTGRVHTGLPPGHAIDVTARFLYGTRHCGKAARRLVVDGLPMPAPPADPARRPCRWIATPRNPTSPSTSRCSTRPPRADCSG